MRESSLPAPLLNLLAMLVEERAGIHYGERDRDLFESKLCARAGDAGFESPLDYYYFLRYDDKDGTEFDALVDTLVVHETYFFREVEPLRVACDAFLVPAVNAGNSPRVWCAAAASGEEPLTLAMLLDERGLLGKVEIIASDISRRVLARAALGAPTERAMRATTDESRRRWFTTESGRTHVAPSLTSAVQWRRVNLVDASAVAALGLFDLVLCRNVLIYFADAVVRRVAESLAARLAPEARLLVGASESLLRFGTALTCEEVRGSFFYRSAR